MLSRLGSRDVLKRLLMVAMLAGVFCLSGALVAFISFRGRTVEVPNILGKPESDAEDGLQDRGLRMRVINRAHNDKAEPNTVMDQSPAPGTTVKTGQLVRVSISLGVQK
ncbi:MAG: PASTA domain-containing protein [Blastocatellia bacterium]